ncbi:Hypothetical protein NTJ_13903 [Nesidiocoris tenuis]|uniref:Uncharacterized protein n=1 Tax=Nesidiocoris tenuis TaxID=355587 RepID=A0ABN7BD74_9HEMI|nr:Hypothetical protein NTJ_13903 [Nesidiocoris tenuis]
MTSTSTERLTDPEGGMINGEELSESVEELRARLESMKKLLAESQSKNRKGRTADNFTTTARYDSLIDGNFLSAVFAIVFVLIVGVSFYAFQNLYFAILKKFPAKHTEL